MKKQIKLFATILVFVVFTFTLSGIYATGDVVDSSVKNVTNEAELLAALADTTVEEINIANDITTTAKVNIVRDVTINGNSHKITLEVDDNTVWGGYYVLQAYRCNVVISDITLTGGNAGLLINGSNVVLTGIIDVSGNGFGGIELAKSGENMPSLDLTSATLKNTSEAYKLPTIWEDPAMSELVITEGEDFLYSSNFIAANGNEQWQYYLDLVNVVDTPENH